MYDTTHLLNTTSPQETTPGDEKNNAPPRKARFITGVRYIPPPCAIPATFAPHALLGVITMTDYDQ